MDDEALMRGRVYGADHDIPTPARSPQPGHEYRAPGHRGRAS
ncbi:hypothetical protein [Streptomyces sp. CBMA123]|nr:hypothetical protein [Streptomyces sp. CBMA123]